MTFDLPIMEGIAVGARVTRHEPFSHYVVSPCVNPKEFHRGMYVRHTDVGGATLVEFRIDLLRWLDEYTPGWQIGSRRMETRFETWHLMILRFAHEVDRLAFTMVQHRFGLPE